MKKKSAVLICTAFLMAASGCSAQNRLSELINAGDSQLPEETSPNPRVYMDEFCGTVKDFSGNRLTLLKEGAVYSFDVSQAQLECKNGIITGDEVNVIYQGQLESTDTQSIKVLKVVDPFHNKPALEEKTFCGQIQKLTFNSITLKSKGGKTAVYPLTGVEQYYQNGIKAGNWVYLHFLGNYGDPVSEDGRMMNAAHLKLLSVSDTEPFQVPDPTPTPPPAKDQEPQKEQKLRASVRSLNLNTLEVLPEGSKEPLKLDMSALPCYFSGGIAKDSRVSLIYTGKFNGTSLEGMTLLGITGEIPEKASAHSVSHKVSGEIIGSTANTITIRSTDGMALTFYTDSAVNRSTGGLLTGSSVSLTFNPADSRKTNIYTCLTIEDA